MTASKTPKLRFKEFKNEWENYKFEDIYDFKKVFSFSRDQLSENEGKIYNVHYGDIHTRYNSILDISKVQIPKIKNTDSAKFNEDDFCKNGDLIIADASEDYKDIGKSIELFNVDRKITAGLHTFLARPKISLYSGISYLLMKSKNTRNQIMKISTGTSVLGISKSNLSKISIYLPDINEQQKIANFLILVDKYIQSLKSQKEELEKYKKAVMQKIFSQQIRFKDENGKDFPDWKGYKLNEVLKERKEYSQKGKGFKHISLTTEGVVPKSDRYDRDFLVSNDEIKKYKITRLNDLCYNPANLKFGVIALNKLNDGIFSPIYVTFEIINQDTDFIAYFLIRNEFINKARKYEQGTVYERMSVSPDDFLKIKVTLPTIIEQIKIKNFIKDIDRLIQNKAEQIKFAEEWKKGLMQQMFV